MTADMSITDELGKWYGAFGGLKYTLKGKSPHSPVQPLRLQTVPLSPYYFLPPSQPLRTPCQNQPNSLTLQPTPVRDPAAKLSSYSYN